MEAINPLDVVDRLKDDVLSITPFPEEVRHETRVRFEDGVRELVASKTEDLASQLGDFCDRGLAYWTHYKEESGESYPTLSDGELVDNKIETYRRAKEMIDGAANYPRQLATVTSELQKIATRQIESEYAAAKSNKEYDFSTKKVITHHFPFFTSKKELFLADAERKKDAAKKTVEAWQASVVKMYPGTKDFFH